METTNYVIAEEIAIEDFKNFYKSFIRKPIKDEEQFKDEFFAPIEAIKLGNLIFEDSKPVLTLEKPVKNTEGGTALGEVKFKTRVPVMTMKNLQHGLTMPNDQFELSIRLIAYLIDQPAAMLDKIENFDLEVITKLTAVFL
ncbi:hypothetical protein [Mucilaginibacter sp. NFR10]|uniref:hypothetical protein n=1 Tax=Mucilaginibacter sp. NFR10 TaxID=1566292 RepID=UPI000871728A|nr:hypothetical protein [Mucilaginibacter sp. NFR10]SCW88388.1 hypothetical protein SAMN03159284_05382 [Mucilaginibacter sp. NFR10]